MLEISTIVNIAILKSEESKSWLSLLLALIFNISNFKSTRDVPLAAIGRFSLELEDIYSSLSIRYSNLVIILIIPPHMASKQVYKWR